MFATCCGTPATLLPVATADTAFGVGGTPPFGAPEIGFPTGADVCTEDCVGAEPVAIPFLRKYSIQAGSTELGSF
jgi:hypothetical protein